MLSLVFGQRSEGSPPILSYERRMGSLTVWVLQIKLGSEVTRKGMKAIAMMPFLKACTLECSKAPYVLQNVSVLKDLTHAEVCDLY